MTKNDHCRQSLVPFREVYLSYGLSACYETSRLVGNIQTVKRQMFSWYLSASSEAFTYIFLPRCETVG